MRGLFLQGLAGVEKAGKFGRMCGWPNHPSTAAWRTPIPFLVFARWRACRGCSVTRVRASSPSFGGKKNGLWPVRYVAPHVVRPPNPSGPGSALCRSPHLPRSRGSARPVSALPQWHDQGRGRRIEPGPADGQAAGNGLHAQASMRSRSARVTPIASWSATWSGAARSGSAAKIGARRAWIGQKKARRIRLAVMDMREPFRHSTEHHAPNAAIGGQQAPHLRLPA